MPQQKKPTNKQLEKLLLKIQSKLFGLSDKEIQTFDDIVSIGNPLNFYSNTPLLKSLFIEDIGITLIHTLNHAIVRRNFCNTIYNSHVSGGESSPYALIGMAIDLFQKYECTTLVSLLQKEKELEHTERIIIDCFVMWVNALSAPQFECGLQGTSKREHINSMSRLQLLFDCSLKCDEVFLNNEKDITQHEYYNEFIKRMRIQSFLYKNIDNSEEIIKIEDEAYEKIKSRIIENGNELNPYIALIAPKFESENDSVLVSDISIEN
jgi:hypothetical protein